MRVIFFLLMFHFHIWQTLMFLLINVFGEIVFNNLQTFICCSIHKSAMVFIALQFAKNES